MNSRWFTRVWVLQEVAAAKRVAVACGDKVVGGSEFYGEIMGLTSWSLSLEKTLRKSHPALELINQSTSDLSARSLPLLELMESFRGWDATKPVDKLFALLFFSSDASHAAELQPDYLAPAPGLARRIVQFAFPSCVIDAQPTDSTEVAFEIEGLLLGRINSKMRKGRESRREFGFSAWESPEIPGLVINPRVAEFFGRDSEWAIRISNERRLTSFGNTVLLLRGASRPTVVSFRDGKHTTIMLATPVPRNRRRGPSETENPWPSVLNTLAAETEGLVKVKLCWDPFRKPHPSEVSSTTLTANDPAIQWEATVASMKDKVDNGAPNDHNCRTIAMLRTMFNQDKDAIKAGMSEFTMTLHKAAYNGWCEATKLLLDANADVDEWAEIGNLSVTPLHLAAYRGHAKIVRALLAADGMINPVDDNGYTPLDLAFEDGHDGVAQLLLQAGGIPLAPAKNNT